MPFVEVKKLDILSVAKILSLLQAMIGIVIGFIYGLVFFSFGLFGRGSSGGLVFVFIGIAVVIGFPIFAGVFGFIYGLIIGLVYNFASGLIGGLKFQLEEENDGHYEPPPPQY
ncbi:MAG: hypothetical protein ACRD63_00150 [Pyrinomonadaceae bacterium]